MGGLAWAGGSAALVLLAALAAAILCRGQRQSHVWTWCGWVPAPSWAARLGSPRFEGLLEFLPPAPLKRALVYCRASCFGLVGALPHRDGQRELLPPPSPTRAAGVSGWLKSLDFMLSSAGAFEAELMSPWAPDAQLKSLVCLWLYLGSKPGKGGSSWVCTSLATGAILAHISW